MEDPILLTKQSYPKWKCFTSMLLLTTTLVRILLVESGSISFSSEHPIAVIASFAGMKKSNFYG